MIFQDGLHFLYVSYCLLSNLLLLEINACATANYGSVRKSIICNVNGSFIVF